MEISTIIQVPENVELSMKENTLVVKGSKGELIRNLADANMQTKLDGKNLTLSYKRNSKRQKKQLHSTRAHINNMIKGVDKGFTYKLKICSGHFPMTVKLKGDELEVKNFIGESVPRLLKVKEGTKVKVESDIITVESNDKELAGQMAGAIEKMTKRPGFDNRIFQDGIYIIEKGN